MNLPTWPVQDAKARFSELLDTCIAQGPQMVTKRGAEAAVLVPVAQWRRMQSVARPSLKALLMSDEGRGELVLPERGLDQHRPAVAWE
jgi:prevent-host-death family protein